MKYDWKALSLACPLAALICVASTLVAETVDSQHTHIQSLPDGAVVRLGVTRFRAAGQLFGMKVSPDGHGMATLEFRFRVLPLIR